MADPSTISGLSARWRADSISGVSSGSPAPTWPDTSGNGFAATNPSGTATVPTYVDGAINGLPVVRFTAANSQRLTSSAPAGLAAQTVVAVMIPQTASAARTIRGGANVTGSLQFCLENGTGTARLQSVKQGVANVAFSTGSPGVGSPVVTLFTYDSGSGLYEFRINGSPSGSGTNVQTLVADTTAIGSNRNTQYFAGDIAELLVWGRVLTSAELAAVDSYVQDRYAITVADYVPSTPLTAGYGGSGILASSSSPAAKGVAGYGGAGSLAASSAPAGSTVLGYTGAGAVSTSSKPSVARTVAFSGAGTLTATGSAPGAASVSYTGSGALAATPKPAADATVAYGGTGQLSSAARPSSTVQASYGAAGSLVSHAVPGAASVVAYSGAGQLAATGQGSPGGLAMYSGAGQLTSSSGIGRRIRYGTVRPVATYFGPSPVTAMYWGGSRFG